MTLFSRSLEVFFNFFLLLTLDNTFNRVTSILKKIVTGIFFRIINRIFEIHVFQIKYRIKFICRQARKRERRQLTGARILEAKKQKFPPCARCGQPAGQGCTNHKCKKCCRYQSKHEASDCKGGRFSLVKKEN